MVSWQERAVSGSPRCVALGWHLGMVQLADRLIGLPERRRSTAAASRRQLTPRRNLPCSSLPPAPLGQRKSVDLLPLSGWTGWALRLAPWRQLPLKSRTEHPTPVPLIRRGGGDVNEGSAVARLYRIGAQPNTSTRRHPFIPSSAAPAFSRLGQRFRHSIIRSKTIHKSLFKPRQQIGTVGDILSCPWYANLASL
jgi:hypothetical protein